MSDVLHRCAAAGLCGSKVTEDGKQVPAATPSATALCEGCRRQMERVLGELPEMWLSLELALGDKRNGTDEHVSGTKNPPIPLSVETAAIMDAITEWVSAGAARVAELMNTADPSPVSRTTKEHGRAVVESCRLLKSNLDRLLSSEADVVSVWLTPKETGRPGETWTDSFGTRRGIKLVDMTGVEIGLEIRRVHKLGRTILGHTSPRIRQTLGCPICEAIAVYRTVRTVRGKVYDDVNCESCGRDWTWDRYEQMCQLTLEAMKEDRVTEEERVLAWLACERWWVQAQASEHRLAEVRRVLDFDASGFDAVVLQRHLRDALGEAA